MNLEEVILEWARPKIQHGQVGPLRLRARAEHIQQGNTAEIGDWIHVYTDYEWVCSIKRTLKAGNITVYVQKGRKVKFQEES